MITILLALIQSRATNSKFDPEGLYAGTLIIDLFIVMGLIWGLFL